ncbi:hypothetical protein JCM10213_002922 [Rhodosporidiobolus nylandii]
MDSATLNRILERAAVAGVPPAVVEAARTSPAGLARLAQLLNPPVAAEPDGLPDFVKQHITDAKHAFVEEEKRPLFRPPPSNREQAEHGLAAQRAAIIKADAKNEVTALLSFTGLPRSFSDKALEELTPITFDEMLVSQTHKGSYLLCRLISVPTQQLSLGMIAEDVTGRAEYVGIYHFPVHGVKTGPDLDALFPLGQVLAIKEPTFKMNPSNTSALIRVDSPADVVFLSQNSPFLRDVEWKTPNPARLLPASFDHKARGNSYFRQAKYLLAVRAYAEGVDAAPSDEQKLLLLLNRAQAHLLLRNFASARQEAFSVQALLADDVGAPPLTQVKAQFRLARALEGMRLFAAAKEAYHALCVIEPTSVEGKEGEKRIEEVLRTAKTGEFDFEAFEQDRAEWAAGTFFERAVGDFFGPIKVKKMAEREGGRGIVATRDIEAGELLVVEKAVAVGQQNLHCNTVVSLFDLRDNRAVTAGQSELLSTVIAKMMDDRSVIEQVYALCGGKDCPAPGEAVLGSFSRRSPDSPPPFERP